MKLLTYSAILLACICLPGDGTDFPGRSPYQGRSRVDGTRTEANPLQHLRVPPSGTGRFLASEAGRSFLLATNHPLAAAAIRTFGAPSPTVTFPPSWVESNAPAEAAPAASGCNASIGTRFNLEPRPFAAPQTQPSIDFLLNRLGPGLDLIVESATDWRGNFASSSHWDQSASGYYVHRAAAPDCSTQFEGGLPNFTYQGNFEMGLGSGVVAVDAARDTIFMADVRFGSVNVGGVGLFRASASTLLEPSACPGGTHTAAQAASCWAATPPLLLFPAPLFDSVGDLPRIAVDERRTAAGKGAGDVYVVNPSPDFTSGTTSIQVVACTNTLQCAAPLNVSGTSPAPQFSDVSVRPDGAITISYSNWNSDGSQTIFFTACAPAGAPNQPRCGTPVAVSQVTHPVVPNFNLQDLVNIDLLAYTFPKHVHRPEPGGGFTTFLTYDDCRSPFQYGSPPVTACLAAEVMLTSSTDGGHIWSAPVSVDRSAGHHFYPSIAADRSTGAVHLAYYSAAGDFFNHSVRVFRAAIVPGTATPGTPRVVTTVLTPIDNSPQGLGNLQADYSLGLAARGTGVPGQSRLYSGFDSTVVPGVYSGRPDAELNNHLSVTAY